MEFWYRCKVYGGSWTTQEFVFYSLSGSASNAVVLLFQELSADLEAVRQAANVLIQRVMDQLRQSGFKVNRHSI